ncbi:hypothetical protein RYX36_030471 [Vicia faba]
MAPENLLKNGEPLNKENIYISKTSPPSVYEVYFKQFESDFKNFLKLRSMELAVDGMMALTIMGREIDKIISVEGVIGMVLNQMVQEELVETEKLDMFDVPVYHPREDEVRQVIKEEGSFTLHTMKTFKIGWDANLQKDIVDFVVNRKVRGEFVAKYLRAVFEPLLIARFGENIMDDLFMRVEKFVAELF